jgi:hypothetical protein
MLKTTGRQSTTIKWLAALLFQSIPALECLKCFAGFDVSLIVSSLQIILPWWRKEINDIPLLKHFERMFGVFGN